MSVQQEPKKPSKREKAKEGYARIIAAAHARGEEDLAIRELAKSDLFFLLIYILGGDKYADYDFVFDRCREFEADRDGHLDIWSRFHFKSTIITFAAVIQEILRDPEITIGIFSFNKPTAKIFLRAIKIQFEENEKLKELFPEIFWNDPSKEAPKWSEDDGIVVRRRTAPKEMTLEAHGVTEGQPTGRHFVLRVYDDVVTEDTVSSPDMIEKTTRLLKTSFNLCTLESNRQWFVGTFYHYADTYADLIRNNVAKLRVYPATKDGLATGELVLMSREKFSELWRNLGPYIGACQLLCKPIAEGEQTFSEKDLRYWQPKNWDRLTTYIVVDPAGEKKKTSDYTVMWVVGLGQDGNYYVIDGLRDKLGLKEKADRLFHFVQNYKPRAVGYEKYGMQADIPYIQERMRNDVFNFDIIELGGSTPKNDRIRRLQPLFQEHRIFLPDTMLRTDYQGKTHDLVQSFINDEYKAFPYMAHDDMLDCLARIVEPDLETSFPLRQQYAPDGEPLAATDEYGYNTFDYLYS